MLHAHHTPGLRLNWLMNGGDKALRSFGVEGPEDLPDDLIRLVGGLPTVHEDAERFYVHAGFRLGQPAPDPDQHTRLWIREPFLSAEYNFGKYVIHGHTLLRSGEPDVHPHPTNLDTACVYGGALTAGVFTDERGPAVQFLQVG